MTTLRVIEYEEGCGYNCETITTSSRWWASRYPFNRVEMQNRISRFLLDNVDGKVVQEMVYSPKFDANPR